MPKPTKGARLGGSPAHERLILGNLASQLFQHGAITTTETKAKRVRPLAERLVSKAKRADLHNRRQVLRVIGDQDVVKHLFDNIAPQMEGRDGGYTRITKLTPRKGDNAPMARLELVTEAVAPKAAGASKASTTKASTGAAAPKAAPATETPAPAGEAKDHGEGSYRGENPPAGFDIKGNEDSMKFHTPESPWYDRTIAEVWFNSAEAAEAAGFVNAVKSDDQ